MTQGKREIKTRLAATLEEKGIRSIKLAEVVGVTPAAVSHWVTGKSKPKYDQMKIISRWLDVDLEWLFE